MTKTQTKAKLAPEGGHVEWKQSLGEWKEIVETCAAFATAGGGTIHVGIRPDGTRSGVQIGKGTLEDLANKIAQNTNPRLTPSVSTSVSDDKNLVEVAVNESPFKPVYAFDRPYRRCGSTNQRLSPEEAMHIYLGSRGMTWDQTPVKEAGLDDIDSAAVHRFLRIARTERQWDVNEDTPTDQVLRQLGLIQGRHMTVAGVLLFGRRPQQFMPQAVVRCGRFKGTDAVHFLDMDAIQGTTVEQVERAMSFVKRNIRMGVAIRDVKREDVWEYPLEGVREALINAVCHRDYASTANVQIRIFDDRLEIWNPGGLPEGMTVDDLWRQHESKPRNRLLAQSFFLIKYVEQFGTGIQRILDDCREHGTPQPEFEVHGQTFRAVFRPGTPTETTHADTILSEREEAIIALLKKQGKITRNDIESILGLPGRTASRDLKVLETKGVVVRRGTGRNSWYALASSA